MLHFSHLIHWCDSPMIPVEPTADTKLPFDLSDEHPATHADAISIAVNTADLIGQLGGSIDFSVEDIGKAAELINGTKKHTVPVHVKQSGEAAAASALIKRFDFQAFADAQQARNFVTNRLVQIADCGDTKLELKALELLGKHSDVGLFTERSEITVHHTTSSSLEQSIKERVKRLLNSDVTDITPLDDLDAQLGPIEAFTKVVEKEGFGDGPIKCPVCGGKGDPIPTCGCVTYEDIDK
jgi:hypothetical protein